MDTALVIIDVQNDYFPQGKCELFQSEQALKVTKRLLEHFRERKLPIFYVQHISPEDAAFFLPNTKGVQLHKEIEPLGSEYIIVLHGGQIRAESSNGRTAFIIEIPSASSKISVTAS